MKKISLLIFTIFISATSLGQEFSFDIYNHSLQDYIQIEKKLGSEQLPKRNGVSLTKNALPFRFLRPKDTNTDLPRLIVSYYFRKNDSIMSQILYEWDVSNFEKDAKKKKSNSFEKKLRKKYRSIEKRITKIFGKPKEVNGDLSDLSKSNTEKGLEKEIIWHPNDSIKIDLHSTISNYYGTQGRSTFYPDHNIRLFVRKIEGGNDPNLNKKRIDCLNNIVENFTKTIVNKNFDESKKYLSTKALQIFKKNELFSLNKHFDFNKKIELAKKSVIALPNGNIVTILLYKYKKNDADSSNKMMQIIFNNNNNILGIKVSK